MTLRDVFASARCADIKDYLYFIVSTGLYQTYRGWVSDGRKNPHVKIHRRKEPTTRTELVSLFKLDGCA